MGSSARVTAFAWNILLFERKAFLVLPFGWGRLRKQPPFSFVQESRPTYLRNLALIAPHVTVSAGETPQATG
jgi:hypothetical protein